MKNIFLEKLYAKYAEKLVLDPFLKNQNGEYLWISTLDLLLLYTKLRAIEIY